MNTSTPQILVINSGSSSIKFAFYQRGAALQRGLHGRLERIGLDGATLTFADDAAGKMESIPFDLPEHSSTVSHFVDWLKEQDSMRSVEAVGHRVVHGMKHTESEEVTQDLLDELHRISTYDPAHLPREIELDLSRNTKSERLISSAGGRVAVRVICTDEESMIARSVRPVLRAQ